MCFGRKDKSLTGDAGPARVSASVPQQDEKTSKPPQVDILSTHSKESSQPLAPKKKKKAKDDYLNDEYGQSVSMALHMKTQKRIKELYPDGVPADMKGANGSGMSQGNMGGPMGGGAGMAMF